MSYAKTRSATTVLPRVVFIISILLVFDGIFALLGCLFYQDTNIDRLYGAAGSVVIIATGILIFLNHSAALPLSFVCAVLLTGDAAFKLIRFPPLLTSTHTFLETARTIFNIGLYWVGFLSYKKWRTASTPQTDLEKQLVD